MTLRRFGLGLVLGLLAPGAWAQAGTPAVILTQPIHSTGAELEVNLQAVDAAALAQQLGTALGATVRVEGVVTAPVTVDLEGMPARAALDAVAGALHGSWRSVYTITPGAAPAGTPAPVPLGRKVTASLDEVSAHAAFALVARAAGGTLEMPPDLTTPVTLDAKQMPVEQALDTLAKQTATRWSVTYFFKPGVAPPPPAPRTAPERRPAASRSLQEPLGRFSPGSGQPSAAPNERRAFPMPFGGSASAPAAGMGADAGKMLARGLAQVMQIPAPQRGRAVNDFAAQLDQQFRQMAQMPQQQRMQQMTAMRPVYAAALRTYNGLVPAQRREFLPIIEVFRRWLR